MNVLVFDIDGTLTRTTQVDEHHFKTAIQTVLPASGVNSMGEFLEMTDTAILQEICSFLGENHYASVEARVLEHFMGGLSRALIEDPSSFSVVPGARTIFSKVRDAGWIPAIATGAWRPSAELKLNAAGIPTADVPLATSSEAVRRVDIIRAAVADAASGMEPDELVYVGDGSWDVRACKELGIGFIGRAEGPDVERLQRSGANAVVTDFENVDAFLNLLSQPNQLALSPGQA